MQASQALSQCSHPGYAQFPQQGVLAAYGKCSLPGQPVKDLVPRALPGINHVGSLCLEHTHIPEPPEESRGSPWIDSRHSEPFLLVRGGAPPEIQVPRYQPRAHLVSSPLSKPAVLTFFCICPINTWVEESVNWRNFLLMLMVLVFLLLTYFT